MKNFKLIIVLIVGCLSGSCNLEEDPIILNDTLYNTEQGAQAALDGIYRRATDYSAQARRLITVNGYSGFFNTNRGAYSLTNVDNQTLFSLKPILDSNTESYFRATYAIIAQANAVIAKTNSVANPQSSNELLFNDVRGQAYLMRAWSYFNLVRLFGDIPLWTVLPDSKNISQAKSSAKVVYEQVIADAKMAATLINGAKGVGYPKQYAANMLLAKLYMTLATNTTLQSDGLTEMDYWQMAYDEAIKLYGKYSLISNYADLFTSTFENTTESILEFQISIGAANSQLGRDFSPWNWKPALSFAHLKVNANIYVDHAATYPGDPRLAGTYAVTYRRADNGTMVSWYPDRPGARTSYFWSHPYFFKYAEKDQTSRNLYTDQNHIVYRYADLLLMLAEISNELQNGEQLGYVTEVLNRVGMTPVAAYSGTKEEFRDAIMKEYRYELLGEGEDTHNNRRRGFTYFKEKIIDVHNSHPIFNAAVDLRLSTVESEVMILPFPQGEINFNDLINE